MVCLPKTHDLLLPTPVDHQHGNAGIHVATGRDEKPDCGTQEVEGAEARIWDDVHNGRRDGARDRLLMKPPARAELACESLATP